MWAPTSAPAAKPEITKESTEKFYDEQVEAIFSDCDFQNSSAVLAELAKVKGYTTAEACDAALTLLSADRFERSERQSDALSALSLAKRDLITSHKICLQLEIKPGSRDSDDPAYDTLQEAISDRLLQCSLVVKLESIVNPSLWSRVNDAVSGAMNPRI